MLNRRTMMGEGGDAGIPITDIPLGSLVKFTPDAVYSYIYAGVAYGNAILIREKASGKKQMGSNNDYPADYENTPVDTYFTDTYYPSLSDVVKSQMADSSISFTTYDGSVSSTKTITRKIFSMSFDEVKSTFLPALKIYANTTSENTARKAKDSADNAAQWWLRDADTSGTSARYRRVTQDGSTATGAAVVSGSGYNTRPALSFKQSVKVYQDNGVYVFQQ